MFDKLFDFFGGQNMTKKNKNRNKIPVKYVAPSMELSFAFSERTIEFYGSARDNIDWQELTSRDLIINCSGRSIKPEPFIKKAPDFINITSKPELIFHEIMLDWPDMQPPPGYISLKFWEKIISQAEDAGVERIIVCCFAGQGRTGTALAAMKAACDHQISNSSLEKYVRIIRKDYSQDAIETFGQLNYLNRAIQRAGGLDYGDLKELQVGHD